ncbi:50S ribosomal protein L33 [Candidatus Margulisiibacteriota bacterium]
MRVIITLRCEEKRDGKNCGSAYTTTKNKRNTADRIVIKKYCRFCRKHTDHKETK